LVDLILEHAPFFESQANQPPLETVVRVHRGVLSRTGVRRRILAHNRMDRAAV